MSASAASEEERESGDARLLSGVAEECDQLPGRGAILTRSGAAMLLAAALCLALTVRPAGGQYNTLFTATTAGGTRQASWSGTIAYTSFEEPAQDPSGAPVLGSGSAYFDTFAQCLNPGVDSTGNALWDHELAAASEYSPSAPVRYSTCTEGIYELGFRSFYQATMVSEPGANTGLCDGDDVGVVGDSTTAQGGSGAGSAPDGSQFYMLEDTGGSFVFIALDSVDVSTYTSIAVKFYYRVGNTNWEDRDMIKVWSENATGAETVMLSAIGGGGVGFGDLEEDNGNVLARSTWSEVVEQFPPTYGEINLKFGLKSNSGDEEAFFDFIRVEGTGEQPPSYTYLVSNCEGINRLGCSNVPDTCGPCFEGYHAGDAFENSNVPCQTCASLNRGDTGSPLARWNNYEQTICKACLPGYVAFSDAENLMCYTSPEDTNLCQHHPNGGFYYIGTRVVRCMEKNTASAAPASASFENICTDAGVCPTDATMRGQTEYCHTGVRDAVNYPGVNIEDELLTVERLLNHASVNEPLVQQTVLTDLAKTSYPGDLGWKTYWRPTASKLGQATCQGCAKDGSQPNTCHSLGARRGEELPHKPTPHGKQYYTVGGDSDGFVFVVVDPVTVDSARTSYMSAWVHVSGSEWQGDAANTNRLDAAVCTGTATETAAATCAGGPATATTAAACTGTQTTNAADCASPTAWTGGAKTVGTCATTDGCTYSAAVVPTCDLDATTDSTADCPAGCTYVAAVVPTCDLDASTDSIATCPAGCTEGVESVFVNVSKNDEYLI